MNMKMNMKRWLISAVTLTFALGTAGAVTAFALTADGGGDNPEVPNGTESAGEVSPGLPSYDESLSDPGDGQVVTSIDDIDPNVCNWIHNINACTAEELEELGMGPIAGSSTVGEPDPGDGRVVTSIDDIDPNVCNAIHNINACTAEELEELGMGPIAGSSTVGEPDTGDAELGG